MTILVSIKNVYGKEMIYPENTAAQVLADLTGKKTLSRNDIEKIKSLGFTVEVKTKTL